LKLKSLDEGILSDMHHTSILVRYISYLHPLESTQQVVDSFFFKVLSCDIVWVNIIVFFVWVKMIASMSNFDNKIAWSIFGTAVFFSSLQLLSQANICVDMLNSQKNEGNAFFYAKVKNYALMTSAAVFSLGTAYYVANKLNQ